MIVGFKFDRREEMKKLLAPALIAMIVFCAFAAPAQQAATSGNCKIRGNDLAEGAGPSVSQQLNDMKDSIQVQQQHIEELMQQLQSRETQIQELQQQMNRVQGAMSEAQQKGESANSP